MRTLIEVAQSVVQDRTSVVVSTGTRPCRASQRTQRPSTAGPTDTTSPSLTLTVESSDGIDRHVLVMTGEHDASTVALLRELLDEFIAVGHDGIIVDVSGVTFLGVAPVRVLVAARRRLERSARTLDLRSPSRSALRVLQLCDVPLPEPLRYRVATDQSLMVTTTLRSLPVDA